jgi:MscS family membrane protein
LAEQLEKVLARDPQFDVGALNRQPEGDLKDGLPENRERIATFKEGSQSLPIELERIPLRSGLSVWLVAPESVAQIPRIAQLESESWLERMLPAPLVEWRILEMPLWQWIALCLLFFGVLTFSGLLTRLCLVILNPLMKRFVPLVNGQILTTFEGPLRLLLAIAAFRIGMEWIEPAMRVHSFLQRALILAFFLGIAWLAGGLVDLAAGRLRTSLQARHQFSYSVLPLAARVLKITILLLALMTVLSDWGYNTSTLLAGLGVGGLAIALAAQKTVENLFGGVAVISDRPVVIGDFCKFGDRSGTVEDIGLRSTRIRTPDRTLITVPNGQFSAMTLENFSQRDKTMLHFTLNLRRDTTPDQVRQLLDSIGRILRDHRSVEAGAMPARFVGVGTYSLDLEVFVYVLTPDGDQFLKIQQELLLAILDAVEAAGTALALPTQASVPFSAPVMNGKPPAQPEHALQH